MNSFSQQERILWLDRMAGEGVDVLVIGGGITGSAVAMDAAVRGYRVGLVEKGDFASGTSSKSTSLVHGGLRYLPQLDFPLVHEALVERGLLFRNAPWIVEPLPFVLPLYEWNRRPLGTPIVPPFGVGLDLMLDAGLTVYDGLAGRLNIEKHQRLTQREARRLAPALKTDGWRHAFAYFDGRTDDVRLTMAVLKTAVHHGATAANYAGAVGFDIAGGRIRSAAVRDELSGALYTIPARHVVNAGGVFAQRIEGLTGLRSNLAIEPAKGVHLVVSGRAIPMSRHAIVLPETDDGRVLFVIPLPYRDRVLVGTTDTMGGDVDDPRSTDDDIDYLIEHSNRYLQNPIGRSDIIGTYAGYRPLVRSTSADDATSKLSRGHAVLDGPAGMISVVGGKLTTWRLMGEDTVNHIARRDGLHDSDLTKAIKLVGGEGLRPLAGFDDDVRKHLAAAYGSNSAAIADIVDGDPSLGARIIEDLPFVMAEVVYACRHEMAVRLDDVLARRTKIAIVDRDNGRAVAKRVADVMAVELNWDAAETRRQVEAYESIDLFTFRRPN